MPESASPLSGDLETASGAAIALLDLNVRWRVAYDPPAMDTATPRWFSMGSEKLLRHHSGVTPLHPGILPQGRRLIGGGVLP